MSELVENQERLGVEVINFPKTFKATEAQKIERNLEEFFLLR